ncbi:hypothetical protein V9K97_22070 [Variovorax sp. CCNWLW186]|uniref:hypothetical protein n=1 Tax=Variovorax sp. CCNWLW186 TaxID=3127473 RepID=UPI003077F88B
MNYLLRPLALLALLAGGMSSTMADPHKDESGHGRKGRHGGHEYKEEYRDGWCKVERKWDKNGEFKEERKCKGHAARAPRYEYEEAPAYHRPPPGVIVQPPAMVVEPPTVVIRP